MARSTGAAPRQRGKSEKCTFTKPCGNASSSETGSNCPKATTTPSTASLARTSSTTSRAFSGVRSGSPRSTAARFTGDQSVPAPRVRLRSGCVTTSATS